MDIYRKELNDIYARQRLHEETLPSEILQRVVESARTFAALTGAYAVVTDIATDRSYTAPGIIGRAFGLLPSEMTPAEVNSSDEDFLYARMHPSDLVDLRMLEHRFLAETHSATREYKMTRRATADVRMRSADRSSWVRVAKSTQVAALSPGGAIWLMLCCYEAAASAAVTTSPRIADLLTAEVRMLSLTKEREGLLSDREKEVLLLIRAGKLSKEIAHELQISPNTVSRHRQNILHKLSVDNSMEAVNAAIAMGLI